MSAWHRVAHAAITIAVVALGWSGAARAQDADRIELVTRGLDARSVDVERVRRALAEELHTDCLLYTSPSPRDS